MQLALDHPAASASPKDIRFFIAAGQDDRDEDVTGAGNTMKAMANEHPPVAAVDGDAPESELEEEEDDDFAELFEEERRRCELLEQKLASAVLLLHETAAERDRWHSQAQRALAMIDSLQRQLTTPPLRKSSPPRRRLFGLF